MIKIIITITQLLMTSNGDIQNQMKWGEAINNVQDQMTWVREDINNGRISEEEAQYYLDNLNRTEDLLIELYKLNTIK